MTQHATRRTGRRSRRSSPRPLRQVYHRALVEPLEERCLLAVDLLPIANVTSLIGAPLPVALTATADNPAAHLTYSVSYSSPELSHDLLTATSLATPNRSLRISTADGDMEFQLFENFVPTAAGRVAALASAGAYGETKFESNLSNYIRLLKNQPGGISDPFDDEFHQKLQLTGKGILALHQSKDDDNNTGELMVLSQANREYDFDQTIVGFLTAGEGVRATIEGRAPDETSVTGVSLFTDYRNGVLLLNPTAVPAGGQVVVTVTVSDGQGGMDSESFSVSIQPDNNSYANAAPFLNPLPAWLDVPFFTPSSLRATAEDADGGSNTFTGAFRPTVPGQNVVHQGGGVFSIPALVPQSLAAASHMQGLEVAAVDQALGRLDSQKLPIFIEPQTPTAIVLLSNSDSGENVTNRNNTPDARLRFRVEGVVPGAYITLWAHGQLIGQAVAPEGTVTGSLEIETSGDFVLGNGPVTISAVQTLRIARAELLAARQYIGNWTGGDAVLDSAAARQQITVNVQDPDDKTPPAFTSTPGYIVNAGDFYSYDANSNEDHRGVVFGLEQKPEGMVINAGTGVIEWTPRYELPGQPGQQGLHFVTVTATDTNGNVGRQAYELYVGPTPVLRPVGNKQVAEGSKLEFQLVAVDDRSAVTFSVVSGAPDWYIFNQQTGEFSWTPVEAQGPGRYAVTFKASDGDGLSATQTVIIDVSEVNQTPTLAAVADQLLVEGHTLSLQLVATDADLPANTLRYTLGAGAPAAARIDAAGRFTWQTTEEDGGTLVGPDRVYVIPVRVSDGAAFDEKSFRVTVREAARPPEFVGGSNPTARAGATYIGSVHAVDTDVPALPIAYELLDGAPEGMEIDAAGVIRWDVPADWAAGEVAVAVRAIEYDLNGNEVAAQETLLRINVTRTDPVEVVADIALSLSSADLTAAAASAFLDGPAEYDPALVLGDVGDVVFAADAAVAPIGRVFGDNGVLGALFSPDRAGGGPVTTDAETTKPEPEVEPKPDETEEKTAPPAKQGAATESPRQQRQLRRTPAEEANDAAIAALLAEIDLWALEQS